MSAAFRQAVSAGRHGATGRSRRRMLIRAALLLGLAATPAAAQFRDDFDGPRGEPPRGWTFFTGDGAATMDFRNAGGQAALSVDATRDVRGIWWALIKRDIAGDLDLARLSKPGHALRLEARIRLNHAPRRVNLHFNTQRTTDFHSQLMEYDIPDTLWHTISMTVADPDVRPGDHVNVQMALMDWGLSRYRADIDYYRADVVDAATAPPDMGEPLPYRPPVPVLSSFGDTATVVQDGMVDLQYPEINYAGWAAVDGAGKVPVLTVSGTQLVILRWDLRRLAGRRAAGPAVLELTTRSLQRTRLEREEFGQVHVNEILAGDPEWQRGTVTLQRLTAGRPLEEVINTQTIMDVDLAESDGGRTLVTLSRPVIQRMLDGRTVGIMLRPLGAIDASLYGLEHDAGRFAPRLYIKLSDDVGRRPSTTPPAGSDRR